MLNLMNRLLAPPPPPPHPPPCREDESERKRSERSVSVCMFSRIVKFRAQRIGKRKKERIGLTI
jgi:hypothetical protein